MPLRSARCYACQHTVDYLSPKEDAPVFCPACGGSMGPTLTTPAPGIVTGTDNRGGWKRPPERDGFRVLEETPTLIVRQKGADVGVWVEWTCDNDHKDGDIFDAQPAKAPSCKACDAPTRLILGVPQEDWFTAAGYHASGGYHDDVLGCWVRSPEHRREILASMGLAEGGPDAAALLRQAERKAEEERQDRAVYEMLNIKLPDTPDIREKREQGLIPDEEWARQDLAKMYGWK